MGILVIEESGRRGEVSLEGRTYTRTFRAETDDPRVGPAQIRQAAGVPRPGDPYISTVEGIIDPSARCSRVSVSLRQGSSTIWDVEVSYETGRRSSAAAKPDPAGTLDGTGLPATLGGLNAGALGGGGPLPGGGAGAGGGDGGAGGGAGNPLARPIKISFSGESQSVVMTTDVNGVAIVNSAGAPFDPPLEEEEALLRITITRNLPRFNALAIRQYKGAVNENDWLGFPSLSVQCTNISGQGPEIEEGVVFWVATVDFLVKPEDRDWQRKTLDAGHYYLDAGAKKKFLDSFGSPIGQGLLNGAGGKLADGAAPVFKLFLTRKAKDFKKLMGF